MPSPAVPHTRRSENVGDFDVSIVLPCLNEEASVGLCVTEAHEALAGAGLTGEVVVVDNGSTDASAEVARTAGARVVAEAVPGYGAAIRGGIRVARGRVVDMADADCTYPLDRLAELVRPVLDGEVDLCLGSRLEAASNTSMPLLHRFVGTPVLTALVRQGGGAAHLTDSQSGFRAFGRQAINGLGLRATGMEFASEMLLRASQADWRLHEIPLGYRERVGESKLVTWRDGWRHLSLIMRLTPHQLLWFPGLALTGLAAALYVLGLVTPSGIAVGSVTWQPVFFASICLVLGALASLAGALVGYHLPSAARRVRHRFRWVGHPSFPGRLAGAGLLGVGTGLLIDAGLLLAWLGGVGHEALRLSLAGLAQGLIVTGATVAVASLLYRLLGDLRDVGAPQPATVDLSEGPGTTAGVSATSAAGGQARTGADLPA